MAYRLFIFDFDGTLADSFPWFCAVLNQVADRYGFRRVEAHEVETLRGWEPRQMLAHLRVPAWKLPMIANHMRGLMARDICGIRLFEGADALLRRLAEGGATLAVVTSNSEENVRRVLGPETASRIAYYECGASLFGKASKFRKVLKRSGVAPADAICVGDEIRDIDAARKTGLACGAVSWGYARPDALIARRPDRIFASFDDVAAALARPATAAS